MCECVGRMSESLLLRSRANISVRLVWNIYIHIFFNIVRNGVHRCSTNVVCAFRFCPTNLIAKMRFSSILFSIFAYFESAVIVDSLVRCDIIIFVILFMTLHSPRYHFIWQFHFTKAQHSSSVGTRVHFVRNEFQRLNISTPLPLCDERELRDRITKRRWIWH